jgi:hypothetical protein
MMRFSQSLFLLGLVGLSSTQLMADVPDRATAEAKIRSKCAADFADSFSTQSYCVKINKEGYTTFVANRAKARAVLLTSYERCQSDFGNEGNWSTATFCVKTNTEGYYELLTLKASASPALIQAYAKCERDFGAEGNWSTAAYCAKQERDAYRDLGN